MTVAALPPIAGSTPMRMPTSVDHTSRKGRERISHSTLRCETVSGGALIGALVRSAALIFSMSVISCAKAKMPISTGRNGKPLRRNSVPRVKRGTLMIGSEPTMVMTRPIAPESSPLISDASVSPATMDSANTNSEKYSQGPNSSAIAASGPVAPIRNTPASKPPRKDDQMPSQTARPGWPFWVIGKPSKVVVIADGVPGMPISAAVIAPPAEPPTYTPVIVARPCSGSSPKVKGSTMMMVMVMVTPGSAPPIKPTRVPRNSGTRYFRCRMFSIPASRRSNTVYHPVQCPRGSSTDR